MLTDLQIKALLIRADDASARNEGFDWAPMRPADVDALASTIRHLQGLLIDARSRACNCEAHTFNLVAHLSQPSRVSPLAAAAAVNMLKTSEA